MSHWQKNLEWFILFVESYKLGFDILLSLVFLMLSFLVVKWGYSISQGSVVDNNKHLDDRSWINYATFMSLSFPVCKIEILGRLERIIVVFTMEENDSYLRRDLGKL